MILVCFVAFSCSFQAKKTIPERNLGGEQRENTLLEKSAEGKYEIPSDTLFSIKEDNYLGQYYMFVISADGNAVLTPTEFGGYGKAKVPQNVPVKTRLTQENLVEIIKTIEDVNFFSLRGKYQSGDVECPTRENDGIGQTFTIRIGGKEKRVFWENCFKDGEKFPKQLLKIQAKIEEFVDTN